MSWSDGSRADSSTVTGCGSGGESLRAPCSSVVHLKAANGEIIAASQAYDTKAGAEKGIESVRTNAPAAKVVDLTEQEPAHT